MDAPSLWKFGRTCVADGQKKVFSIHNGITLSNAVDDLKAAIYWYDPQHEVGIPIDDIDLYLENTNNNVVRTSNGSYDNKERVYTSNAGSTAYQLRIVGFGDRSGMSMLRSSLALGLLLPACNPDARSTAPQSHQRGADETNGSDRHATPDPLPTPADGVECVRASDCHPNAGMHATWCGPVKRDFSDDILDSVEKPGTMDGGPNKPGGQPGCLCYLGRCGAQLNDGRVVIGQQPAYGYRPPPPQPRAGEAE